MTSKQLFSTSFFQHSEKNHIKLNSKERQSQTKWESTIPKWKTFIHQLHQLHLPWLTSLFGHPKKRPGPWFGPQGGDPELFGRTGGRTAPLWPGWRPQAEEFFPDFEPAEDLGTSGKLLDSKQNLWYYDIIYIYNIFIYHIYWSEFYELMILSGFIHDFFKERGARSERNLGMTGWWSAFHGPPHISWWWKDTVGTTGRCHDLCIFYLVFQNHTGRGRQASNFLG